MKEYSMLSGCWRQVYASEDGVDISVEDGLYTHIHENFFEVLDDSGATQIKGYFKLYATLLPKAIDWIDTFGPDSGKRFLAIYEITDDEFVFCAADENMNRPHSFEAKPGHTIRKFIRSHLKIFTTKQLT